MRTPFSSARALTKLVTEHVFEKLECLSVNHDLSALEAYHPGPLKRSYGTAHRLRAYAHAFRQLAARQRHYQALSLPPSP